MPTVTTASKVRDTYRESAINKTKVLWEAIHKREDRLALEIARELCGILRTVESWKQK